MYKVKYNDKSYIVNSNDEKSAIEKVKNFRDNGVKNKIKIKSKDERLSPMTYKKLREIGYDGNKWKNLSQEQANKIVAEHKPTTNKSTSESNVVKESKPEQKPALTENKLTREQIDNKIKELDYQLRFRGDRRDKYENSYDDIVSKYKGSDGGPNNIYLKAFLSSEAGVDKYAHKVPTHRDGRIQGLRSDKSQQIKTSPQYEGLRKFVKENAPLVRNSYYELIEKPDTEIRNQIKQLETLKFGEEDKLRADNVSNAKKRGIKGSNLKLYKISENDIKPDTEYYFAYRDGDGTYFEGDNFVIENNDDGTYSVNSTNDSPTGKFKTKLDAYNAALDSIIPDSGTLTISTDYDDLASRG